MRPRVHPRTAPHAQGARARLSLRPGLPRAPPPAAGRLLWAARLPAPATAASAPPAPWSPLPAVPSGRLSVLTAWGPRAGSSPHRQTRTDCGPRQEWMTVTWSSHSHHHCHCSREKSSGLPGPGSWSLEGHRPPCRARASYAWHSCARDFSALWWRLMLLRWAAPQRAKLLQARPW